MLEGKPPWCLKNILAVLKVEQTKCLVSYSQEVLTVMMLLETACLYVVMGQLQINLQRCIVGLPAYFYSLQKEEGCKILPLQGFLS